MTIRQQIIQQIKDYDSSQLNPVFTSVTDYAELESLLTIPDLTEGCYVIRLSRQATTSTPYQRVTEQYQIITICTDSSDRYTSAMGDRAELMQNSVLNALSGHVVIDDKGEETDPMMFISGGLVALQDQLHIWSDIYQYEQTQVF